MKNRIARLILRRRTILLLQFSNTSRLGSNTCNCDFRTIQLHLSAQVTSHLKRSLIVPAWGISFKMRCAFSKSCSDDCTLSKALRHRHCTSVDFGLADKLIIAIYSLMHFSGRPLTRGSSLLCSQSGICIRSAIFQAIQTRLSSSLAHTERDETSLRELPALGI